MIMANHTASVHAAALLLILCLLATGAQCRIIDDGGHGDENGKINFPPDFPCIYKKRVSICKSDHDCYCCFTSEMCYPTMYSCQVGCK